jgi:hypothetical protein
MPGVFSPPVAVVTGGVPLVGGYTIEEHLKAASKAKVSCGAVEGGGGHAPTVAGLCNVQVREVMQCSPSSSQGQHLLPSHVALPPNMPLPAADT